jgi:ABC-type multidrug transport system fused ATPase/permease subunit
MDQVAFVFQNNRLFKTSILENVRSSRPEATRDEVRAALSAAQCDDILEKLPYGMDTVIGTEGTYLSGGEQQRVALARAILKDAPIVVLDEATAFADPENEAMIQKAFAILTKGRTVIMIAHRLSTVVGADKIIVLDNGKVSEEGTHTELVQAKGLYARMWKEYKLPQGYATPIGENGAKLSGGERQRISIARALLKNAPIVLLDEATASLDVENETKVQGALSRLLTGKTVLVIAHRMRTVEAADKIVVLADGKVAEEGSPGELLKKENGIFRRMTQLQIDSAGWSI